MTDAPLTQSPGADIAIFESYCQAANFTHSLNRPRGSMLLATFFEADIPSSFGDKKNASITKCLSLDPFFFSPFFFPFTHYYCSRLRSSDALSAPEFYLLLNCFVRAGETNATRLCYNVMVTVNIHKGKPSILSFIMYDMQ